MIITRAQKCVRKIVKLTLFCKMWKNESKKKNRMKETSAKTKKISERILSAVRDDELLHLLYTYLSECLMWKGGWIEKRVEGKGVVHTLCLLNVGFLDANILS